MSSFPLVPLSISSFDCSLFIIPLCSSEIRYLIKVVAYVFEPLENQILVFHSFLFSL